MNIENKKMSEDEDDEEEGNNLALSVIEEKNRTYGVTTKSLVYQHVNIMANQVILRTNVLNL